MKSLWKFGMSRDPLQGRRDAKEIDSAYIGGKDGNKWIPKE